MQSARPGRRARPHHRRALLTRRTAPAMPTRTSAPAHRSSTRAGAVVTATLAGGEVRHRQLGPRPRACWPRRTARPACTKRKRRRRASLAQAHRADDRVLPARPVRRDHRPRGDPGYPGNLRSDFSTEGPTTCLHKSWSSKMKKTSAPRSWSSSSAAAISPCRLRQPCRGRRRCARDDDARRGVLRHQSSG